MQNYINNNLGVVYNKIKGTDPPGYFTTNGIKYLNGEQKKLEKYKRETINLETLNFEVEKKENKLKQIQDRIENNKKEFDKEKSTEGSDRKDVEFNFDNVTKEKERIINKLNEDEKQKQNSQIKKDLVKKREEEENEETNKRKKTTKFGSEWDKIFKGKNLKMIEAIKNFYLEVETYITHLSLDDELKERTFKIIIYICYFANSTKDLNEFYGIINFVLEKYLEIYDLNEITVMKKKKNVLSDDETDSESEDQNDDSSSDEEYKNNFDNEEYISYSDFGLKDFTMHKAKGGEVKTIPYIKHNWRLLFLASYFKFDYTEEDVGFKFMFNVFSNNNAEFIRKYVGILLLFIFSLPRGDIDMEIIMDYIKNKYFDILKRETSYILN